jgi:hypothetical protein
VKPLFPTNGLNYKEELEKVLKECIARSSFCSDLAENQSGRGNIISGLYLENIFNEYTISSAMDESVAVVNITTPLQFPSSANSTTLSRLYQYSSSFYSPTKSKLKEILLPWTWNDARNMLLLSRNTKLIVVMPI